MFWLTQHCCKHCQVCRTMVRRNMRESHRPGTFFRGRSYHRKNLWQFYGCQISLKPKDYPRQRETEEWMKDQRVNINFSWDAAGPRNTWTGSIPPSLQVIVEIIVKIIVEIIATMTINTGRRARTGPAPRREGGELGQLGNVAHWLLLSDIHNYKYKQRSTESEGWCINHGRADLVRFPNCHFLSGLGNLTRADLTCCFHCWIILNQHDCKLDRTHQWRTGTG